jgi:hypothetical protein
MLRNRSDRHFDRRFALGLAAAAIVGLVGCGEVGDDTETVESAVTIDNSLAANSLAANSLAANSLAANSLAANSLAANSLAANSLMVSALRDPLARQLLKYVVSCALDPDEDVSIRIDGRRYTFPGELGLAPEWGRNGGSCDRACQRWVSACVLARVDAAGVKRTISLRGDNPALAPVARELRNFTDREATYYGNLFVRDRPLFACLSPDKDEDPRVCGDSLADCPMTVVGSCDDACRDEGPVGDYLDCSDRGRAGRGTVYHEAITVFLPKQ